MMLPINEEYLEYEEPMDVDCSEDITSAECLPEENDEVFEEDPATVNNQWFDYDDNNDILLVQCTQDPSKPVFTAESGRYKARNKGRQCGIRPKSGNNYKNPSVTCNPIAHPSRCYMCFNFGDDQVFSGNTKDMEDEEVNCDNAQEN